jgi:hypothetical protein
MHLTLDTNKVAILATQFEELSILKAAGALMA